MLQVTPLGALHADAQIMALTVINHPVDLHGIYYIVPMTSLFINGQHITTIFAHFYFLVLMAAEKKTTTQKEHPSMENSSGCISIIPYVWIPPHRLRINSSWCMQSTTPESQNKIQIPLKQDAT